MSEQISFKEKIRSIQFSTQAMPSRRNNVPPKVNPDSNAWERGIVRDDRGMPLLDKDGLHVGLKEYATDRHKYEEGRAKTIQRAKEIAQKDNG